MPEETLCKQANKVAYILFSKTAICCGPVLAALAQQVVFISKRSRKEEQVVGETAPGKPHKTQQNTLTSYTHLPCSASRAETLVPGKNRKCKKNSSFFTWD